MEMADGIVINKADGDNIDRANLAAAQFRNALQLFPSHTEPMASRGNHLQRLFRT